MLSEKGKQLIVYKNFKYRKEYETQEGMKWRCTKKNCKGKMYVAEDGKTILKEDFEHNHEPDQSLHRQIISNSVKRKAAEEMTKRPIKLIREEINNATLNVSDDITKSDMENIRHNIYRARRKTFPALPKSLSDVHKALEEISQSLITNRGENILLVNDAETNIVCFATKSNLEYLSKQNKIFVDGTFKCCTKYFTQLFTVHVIQNGYYIPLIFSLLANKQSSTYEKLFLILKKECEQISTCFKPNEIVADFETAIHTAARNIWPDVKIIGCRFHLTQSWWRKIQACGLVADYKDSKSENGQFLRYFFALPFLNPAEVSDAFTDEIMAVQPKDPNIEIFTDYILENYVSEEAKFPPELWASPTIESERTTNACEAFHSQFNSNFQNSQPHIFTFVEILKEIHIDVHAARKSAQEKKKIKNKYYEKKKESVQKQLQDYADKKISRMNFIKRISYYYHKTN